MYQQDYISEELKELSPTLANISRINIFKVPEGYFENISSQLLLLLPASKNATAKASVPQGYFENLADSIMARIKKEYVSDAIKETNNISALVAGIGNVNVYSLPQGYFNSLPANIIAQIKNEYKNDVTVETHTISELVAGIGNKNVYSVPQQYFEALAISINTKVKVPAKVIKMKKSFASFRYAAAAVVTGVIGLSAFFLLNKNNDINISSAPTAAVMTEAKHILTTNSFDKELSSVSDASIVSFLESKGQNVEAALVASLTDDKNLPDADDYLLNDNTLDEILKTLDLNN